MDKLNWLTELDGLDCFDELAGVVLLAGFTKLTELDLLAGIANLNGWTDSLDLIKVNLPTKQTGIP